MAIDPPRTIDGVREALPEDRRDRFMAEVGHTPHTMLPALIDNRRGMAVALSLPDLVETTTAPVDLEGSVSR